MKQILRDSLLVCLCMYIVVQTLYDYGQENQILDIQIQEFEETIEKQEQIVVVQDNPTKDNNVSILVKGISNICIDLIKTFLIIVSNFLHILL